MQGQNQLKNALDQKLLYGQCSQRNRNLDINIVKTNQWLKSAGQKVEIEGLIIAAQDHSLSLRNNQANIIKNWIKLNM